ncbi:hypothetical protein AB1N83_007097 [Pleurotus pulmonarius]
MLCLFAKQASRRYVDLIYGASSKWAHWDPPKKLEPGDFEFIDLSSGLFEKKSNMHVDFAAYETIRQIVSWVGQLEFSDDVRAPAVTWALGSIPAFLSGLKGDTCLHRRRKVAEVFSCPGYVLYLPNQSNGTIESLCKRVLSPHPPCPLLHSLLRR